MVTYPVSMAGCDCQRCSLDTLYISPRAILRTLLRIREHARSIASGVHQPRSGDIEATCVTDRIPDPSEVLLRCHVAAWLPSLQGVAAQAGPSILVIQHIARVMVTRAL